MTAGLRRGVLILVFVALVGSLSVLPLGDWLDALSEFGRDHQQLGAVAYVGFVVLATILFLPGSVGMMIGGFMFGFIPGLLLAVVAIPVGAQGAFEFARWVARPWVTRRIDGNERIKAVERALADQAFSIVVLTRLSLIIPFNLLNYIYGATSVKASTHFMATAVGMLPAITLYVYLGTLARDLSQILSGDAAPSTLGYWIIAAGLAAIVAATVVVHRTASHALEKHLINQDLSE